ncbi:MAG: protein kinase domain-containing protein [Planctomycetaceae bacterium]
MNEQEIFCEAIGFESAAERESFVAQACGSDAALRQRVDALLRAFDQQSRVLERPVLDGVRDQIQSVLEQASLLSADETIGFAPSEHAAPSDLDEEASEETLEFLVKSQRPGSMGRLGHYEVESVIGRGGCGIVLRAYDDRLRRPVAIKIIAPELATTSPARKRFLREARATAAVTDQHVVRIYAVEEQPRPYLVMELIAGETLQEKLDRTGPFTVQEIERWGLQIAKALVASHAQGLVHRDIKPSNVLIEHSTDLVKITDFGLARAADDASLTRSGLVSGTPLYMSPEQAQGLRVDQRSDLFSLGSVLYAMCTGHPPFRASSAVAILRRVVEDRPRPMQDLIPEIPQWLVDIVSRLHEKNPADRYQSAADLVEDWQTRRLDPLGQGLATTGQSANGGGQGHHGAAVPPNGRSTRVTGSTAGVPWPAVGIAAACLTLVTAVLFTVFTRMVAPRDVRATNQANVDHSAAVGSRDNFTEISQAPLRTVDFQEIHGVDEQGVQAWAASLPAGYRPTWISPRRGESPFVFDAIAPKSGPPEVNSLVHFIHNDWDTSSRKEYQRLESTHYTVCRAMYGEDAVLIWNAGDEESSYWYTSQNFVDSKIVENLKYERQLAGVHQRYLPVALNVVHREESTHFEVVLNWQPYNDCIWHWSLTAEQLKQRVEHYRQKGWCPHLISTHAGTPGLLFTAAFVVGDQMPAWAYSIGMTESEYEASLAVRKSDGMRPRCVVSWVDDAEVRYAAVWQTN